MGLSHYGTILLASSLHGPAPFGPKQRTCNQTRLPVAWSEAAWRSARAALRSRSRSRTFKSAASAAAVSVSIAAKSGYGCAMGEGVFFWLSTILRQNAMRSLIGSLFQLRRILAIRVRGVVGDASSRWMPVPKKIGGLGNCWSWGSSGVSVVFFFFV